jgi:hypothetical protein
LIKYSEERKSEEKYIKTNTSKSPELRRTINRLKEKDSSEF